MFVGQLPSLMENFLQFAWVFWEMLPKIWVMPLTETRNVFRKILGYSRSGAYPGESRLSCSRSMMDYLRVTACCFRKRLSNSAFDEEETKSRRTIDEKDPQRELLVANYWLLDKLIMNNSAFVESIADCFSYSQKNLRILKIYFSLLNSHSFFLRHNTKLCIISNKKCKQNQIKNQTNSDSQKNPQSLSKQTKAILELLKIGWWDYNELIIQAE